MRIRPCFVIPAVAAGIGLASAWAQDPAPTPEPGPVQAASQSSTPDIDAFREPGSTAKLFPAQSGASQPGPGGQGTNGVNGRNGRRGNSLLNNNGQPRRNRRSNDMLVDQADADPLEVRVAYRRAKTMAMVRDPGLSELLREADVAGTDVQKRAVLREYYTRLFAGVRKIDGSPAMKRHVRLLSQVAEQRYDPQRRAVGGEEELVRGNGGGRRGRTR